MLVRTPKVGRWRPRGGLDSEFPLLGHPPVTGSVSRLAAAMPGSLVRGCLFVIHSSTIHVYTHAHTRTYICLHIYIYIRAYTYVHIPRNSGNPPTTDAPHCRCQLPAQTLILRNRISNVELRIFQQHDYQDQVVEILSIELISFKWL